MGIIRNFINIDGIVEEKDLLRESPDMMVQYSEVDYIFIPKDKPSIKNIYQIVIEMKIENKRIIRGKSESIILFDGVKKLNLICTENKESEDAIIIKLDLPFNTFIEVPKEQEDIEDIKVVVLDAYFQLIEDRKIYSNILYRINVEYNNKTNKNGDIVEKKIFEPIFVNSQDEEEIKNYEEEKKEEIIENKLEKVKENYHSESVISSDEYEEKIMNYSFVDIDEEYL